MSKNTIKAANELRGAVAENQYKDYVLPMIFLKHMSERYEMRREELTALLHDKNSLIILQTMKKLIIRHQ